MQTCTFKAWHQTWLPGCWPEKRFCFCGQWVWHEFMPWNAHLHGTGRPVVMYFIVANLKHSYIQEIEEWKSGNTRTLWHWLYLEADLTLAELCRVTKPGGYVCFSMRTRFEGVWSTLRFYGWMQHCSKHRNLELAWVFDKHQSETIVRMHLKCRSERCRHCMTFLLLSGLCFDIWQ